MAYVDFEKAFDRVDRELLFHKLRSLGIQGKMLKIIQTIYTDTKACVNVNGYLTNEFISHCGVRQGDTLSPTLFGLYINDLVLELNKTGSGVSLSISSLLYADDLAIIAETEEGLQSQLDV